MQLLTSVADEEDSCSGLSEVTFWTEEVVDDLAFRLAIERTETVIQEHQLVTSIHGTGKSLRHISSNPALNFRQVTGERYE